MKMPNLVKKIAKGFLNLLVVVLIFNAILWLVVWFTMRPANKFCENVSPNDNYENVKSKAKAQGYRTYDYKNDGVLVLKIPTQDSPFFRMACVVTFSNGAIISKEVIADD
jgi:hypothetical protein